MRLSMKNEPKPTDTSKPIVEPKPNETPKPKPFTTTIVTDSAESADIKKDKLA